MKKRNLILKIFIYITLIIYVISSITPFLWTMLTSIKLPLDAFSRVPKIINFEPTVKNYVDLWLQVTPEEFAPYAIGIIVVVAILILLGVFAKRLPVKSTYVYLFISAVILAIIFGLPKFVQMAEFYNYFQNSIIVTIGVVVTSISIGCLAGYGLARYRGLLGVVILVVALAFRALPGTAFVLPYFYLGRLSGMFDTYFLLIICLVAANQPFTIWMLRRRPLNVPWLTVGACPGDEFGWPAMAGDVGAAIQHDHLAVKSIEGADPEVPVLPDLPDRLDTVKDALHQGIYGGVI